VHSRYPSQIESVEILTHFGISTAARFRRPVVLVLSVASAVSALNGFEPYDLDGASSSAWNFRESLSISGSSKTKQVLPQIFRQKGKAYSEKSARHAKRRRSEE
jgi:hypothetical protein